MISLLLFIVALFTHCVVSLASPKPDGTIKAEYSYSTKAETNVSVYENIATASKLEFVTNSGVCETTEGVNQNSGYLSVGENQNV